MQLPAWLEATNMIVAAIAPLPAHHTRPQTLVSPRTEVEMEAWKTQESARRERLDSAVREWLSRGRWPATLDATDGYLLTVRIAAAIDWLELGHFEVVVEYSPLVILEALLIDGWADSFLEQHCRRLSFEMSAYFCGRESAGTFTE